MRYKKNAEKSYHFCIEYSNFIDLKSLGLKNSYSINHASELSLINSPQKYHHDVSFVGHILPGITKQLDDLPYSHLLRADIWNRINDLSKNLEQSAINFVIKKKGEFLSSLDCLSSKYYYLSLLHFHSQLFRGEIIKRINSNIKIDIIGGDPAYLHGSQKQSKIKQKNIKYFLPLNDYRLVKNVYAASKINLNITSLQFDNAIINRVIDIAAVGGFLLTDWKPELKNLTEVSQEISYRSIEELNHKIRYYLDPSHEQERLDIAKVLHKNIMEKCSYPTVIEYILQKINSSQETLTHSMKVDLGCGQWKPDGFIGVDCVDGKNVDIVADLSKRFPFADNSVDLLRGHDVIEHLPDRIHTMNEIWRVCKPNAIIDLRVPSTDGRGAFQDPTHVSFWNINSFKYYCYEFPAYLQLCKSYGFKGCFSLLDIREENTEDCVIHVWVKLKVSK